MPPKSGPGRSQDVSVTQGENSHPIDHEVHHEDTNPPLPTVMFDMIKALQASQHEVIGMIKELKDEKNSRNHRELPEGKVLAVSTQPNTKRKRQEDKLREVLLPIPCTEQEMHAILDKWTANGLIRPAERPPMEEQKKHESIDDVRISRQGFEKRVVSQDLQLWLSNAPPTNQKFTLLARAGRQASFVEGIKMALQRALERVP
uniref:Uncharacterized protein n=1 Tax=Fagus sylvatica TaxID=28930 RepID=A0A2N9HS22_FAGSY